MLQTSYRRCRRPFRLALLAGGALLVSLLATGCDTASFSPLFQQADIPGFVVDFARQSLAAFLF